MTPQHEPRNQHYQLRRLKLERRAGSRWKLSSFPYRVRRGGRAHTVPNYDSNNVLTSETVHDDADPQQLQPLRAGLVEVSDSYSIKFGNSSDATSLAESSSAEEAKQENRLHCPSNYIVREIPRRPDILTNHISPGRQTAFPRRVEDMTATEETWWGHQLRSPNRQPKLVEEWKTADSFTSSGRSSCPCSSCFLTSTGADSEAGRHGSTSSTPAIAQTRIRHACDVLDELTGKLKALNITSWVRRRHQSTWSGSSETLPLVEENLIDLKAQEMDLKEEHVRITNEIVRLRELRLSNMEEISDELKSVNGVRDEAILEHEVLKSQERSLFDQLEEIEREIDGMEYSNGSHECLFFEIDNESSQYFEPLSGDEIPNPHIQHSPLSPYGHDPYSVLTHRARQQLDLYNKKWTAIKSSPPASTSPPTPNRIPWPSMTSNFSPESLLSYNNEDDDPKPTCGSSSSSPADEAKICKWNAHELYCSAFGLHPVYYNHPDSGQDVFTFSFGRSLFQPQPPPAAPAAAHHRAAAIDDDDDVARLRALRDQLKLEKVRWHEDKIVAHFGAAAAADERVRTVWSVVMELKDSVDRELEKKEERKP